MIKYKISIQIPYFYHTDISTVCVKRMYLQKFNFETIDIKTNIPDINTGATLCNAFLLTLDQKLIYPHDI